MALLTRIWTENLRNLDQQSLELSSGLNLIYGCNGAGKSSVLEACHLLAKGRSFRTQRLKQIIRQEAAHCSVAGEVDGLVWGRSQIAVVVDAQGRRSRLNGHWVNQHWDIAQRLPLLIFHGAGLNLLTGPPEERRRLLDWGGFFLSPDFANHWQQWRRAHEQRNAAIKSGHHVIAERFEPILAQAGEQITNLRQDFVHYLQNNLSHVLSQQVLGHLSGHVKLSFRRGWALDAGSLEQALWSQRARDMERGFTQSGPQRADLEIHVHQVPANEISRGEQKRVYLALLLAQGLALATKSPVPDTPIFLLDDLHAEMDASGVQQFMEVMQATQWQCLATTLHKTWAQQLMLASSARMFHVEHGEIECFT